MRSLTALFRGLPDDQVREIRKTVGFLMFLCYLMGAAIGIWAYVWCTGGFP